MSSEHSANSTVRIGPSSTRYSLPATRYFPMKLYIAGHQGMVGSALVRRFQREAGVSLLLRPCSELDLTRQAAVEALPRRGKARRRHHRRGAGRRHPCQQHLPGGIPLRQSRHRGEHHPRRLPAGREAGALPRQLVRLPPAGAPADAGGLPAHQRARTDQRGLRHRQDRRPQAVPVLPPPVWRDLPFGHAHQPLRAGRQLPSGGLPRAAGAHPQVP